MAIRSMEDGMPTKLILDVKGNYEDETWWSNREIYDAWPIISRSKG